MVLHVQENFKNVSFYMKSCNSFTITENFNHVYELYKNIFKGINMIYKQTS